MTEEKYGYLNKMGKEIQKPKPPKRKCPIQKDTEGAAIYCRRRECAWWSEEVKCCAILDLAMSIDAIWLLLRKQEDNK